MRPNDQKPASLFSRAAALFTGISIALSAVPALAERSFKPSADAMNAYNGLINPGAKPTPQRTQPTTRQAPRTGNQAAPQVSANTHGKMFWNFDGEETNLVDFSTTRKNFKTGGTEVIEAVLEYNLTTRRGSIDSPTLGVGAPFSLDRNSNIVVDTNGIEGDAACKRGDDPSCAITLHNLVDDAFGVSNEAFKAKKAGHTLPDGFNGRARVPSGGFVDSYTVNGKTFVVYTRPDHVITVSSTDPDPTKPNGVSKTSMTFELDPHGNHSVVAMSEQGYDQISQDPRNSSQQHMSAADGVQLRIAQNLYFGFAADAASHPNGHQRGYAPQETGRFTYQVDEDAAALWGIRPGTEFPIVDAAVMNPYNGYPVIDPRQTRQLDLRGLGDYVHKSWLNIHTMLKDKLSSAEPTRSLGEKMRDYARPKPLDFKS